MLAALRQADIPVIVLKGWALIPTVYGGDYGQRTYADIDLLVHPRDAASARDIVRGLGYGAILQLWPGFLQRYRKVQVYQLPRNPGAFARVFAIGLHWDLLNNPYYFHRMPVEQFLQRAQPLPVAGVDVSALSAEDHLVYDCAHLALHHEYDQALFRYYEMASLLLRAGPTFDWSAVVRRASAWQLVLPVQRLLSHLETLWPGTVPTQALAEISALQSTLAERWVHYWVVDQKRSRTARVMFDWLTMPGLRARMGYLLETAFPSPTYMRQRYGPAPGGLWPLLYLRRAAIAVRYVIQ